MPDLPSYGLKSVKQLFDTCEPLDENGREETLADPSLDQQLVAEVRRLLAIADGGQEEERQANIIGRQLRDLTQGLERGQRLGAYRVEREIGRGGMGIVFLAHRDDGSYRQQVAIKIAPSFASEEELKHFHRERQILAQLQHPNIAMLLDGGATAEQRPYLVMEHIEGSAITDYCEKHRLDLQARLHLFLAVCEAVSFAHSHLVIHRDIKPANVLVTAAGQVKLLDFGVSKILHSEQKNTHTTLLMGLTPAYASPEQVKGEATTTATDVYGLGTLLYRLLSGISPHPGGNASTEQVIRAICEVEPALVSKAAALEDSAIKSQPLRGDIDNIVAKALRKEPENRYTSVSELQKDIERFLRGEPVLATPPGFLYRSGKFVRRYPVASLLALSVFIAISGGLAASTHLANKLRHERDNLLEAKSETERQAHRAQRVTQLLTDMFIAASPENAKGRTVDVDQLLDISVKNTQESLQEEPAVKAQLLKTLAKVKFSTGKHKDAVELQLESMQISDSFAAQDMNARAEDLSNLGNYYREASDLDAAQRALQQAEAILQQTQDAKLLAITQQRRGLVLVQLGKPKQAIEFYRAAQAYWQTLEDNGGEEGISTRYNLAIAYYDIADFPAATKLHEQVMKEKITFYGKEHPQILNSYHNLGQCYMRMNRLQEAEQYLRRTYEISLKTFSLDHITLRTTARQYARLLRRMGYYQRGIDILSKVLKVDAQNEETTALLLASRGNIYFEMGLLPEARRDLDNANEIFTRMLPDSSSISFLSRSILGEVMTLTGEREAGLALLDKIRKLNAEQYGEDDYGVAGNYFRQARISLREQRFTESRFFIERARKINTKYFARNHPVQLDLDQIEAEIAVSQGNLPEAQALYEKLHERLLQVMPEEAPHLAFIRSALGEVLWRRGKQEEGRHLIDDAFLKAKDFIPQQSTQWQTMQARANMSGAHRG